MAVAYVPRGLIGTAPLCDATRRNALSLIAPYAPLGALALVAIFDYGI